jgi:phosphoribosylformylglycinamidine cyclo-ligase
MSEPSKYELRGVSASKKEVHDAIKGLDKGLFPNAFCKILPDLVGGDSQYVNIMHADTAGTKTSLGYLYWKEKQSDEIWHGISQDAIVMNIDDMACVGCHSNIVLSSTIGRNKNIISGQVIKALIEGTNFFVHKMKNFGVEIHLAGGETADVGDIVRTVDVGFTTFARLQKSELIVNDIQPGDVIVGFASSGQASYESKYNSGIGSNGLTLARHDVLNHQYAIEYPESFNPLIPVEAVYTGQSKLTDYITINNQKIEVGELLLSPTRTYLPLLAAIPSSVKREINGIIHCTGGGQTKVLHFINQLKIIKDSLLDIPPVFELIQQNSKTPWKEMYQVFNMGHRLEIYLPEPLAHELIDLANSFQIDAKIIGRVEEHTEGVVQIKGSHGEFEYKLNDE